MSFFGISASPIRKRGSRRSPHAPRERAIVVSHVQGNPRQEVWHATRSFSRTYPDASRFLEAKNRIPGNRGHIGDRGPRPSAHIQDVRPPIPLLPQPLSRSRAKQARSDAYRSPVFPICCHILPRHPGYVLEIKTEMSMAKVKPSNCLQG